MKRKFYADLTDYILQLKAENRSMILMGYEYCADFDIGGIVNVG